MCSAFRGAGDHARAFHHALHGEHWEELLALPLTGTVLDQAWQVAQRGELPLGVREHLARQLAADYALRGQYHHPEMQAALDLLAQSPDGGTRAWAAVKRAEAHIDDAQYAEARAELALLPGTDPVTQAEHAVLGKQRAQAVDVVVVQRRHVDIVDPHVIDAATASTQLSARRRRAFRRFRIQFSRSGTRVSG